MKNYIMYSLCMVYFNKSITKKDFLRMILFKILTKDAQQKKKSITIAKPSKYQNNKKNSPSGTKKRHHMVPFYIWIGE